MKKIVISIALIITVLLVFAQEVQKVQKKQKVVKKIDFKTEYYRLEESNETLKKDLIILKNKIKKLQKSHQMKIDELIKQNKRLRAENHKLKEENARLKKELRRYKPEKKLKKLHKEG